MHAGASLTRFQARQWLTVPLGCIVCLASRQVWLTVRLMAQNRNLDLRRPKKRLEQIADLALAQLSRTSRSGNTDYKI